MNTIKPISISQLNTDELIKTGRSITTLTNSLREAYPFVDRHITAIKVSLGDIATIDGTEQKKESTKSVQYLDERLDKLLPLIESDLEGSVAKKEFFPTKATAAEAILALFQKRDRKKLFFGSYVAQGREMEALKKELYSSEYEPHIENSGIADLFEALLDTYSDLTYSLNERLNEGNLSTTLKEQKGILRYRLDKLISYIDVNILDNIDGFSVVQTPINELVTEIMSDYKARMTRKEHSESSESSDLN